MASPTDESTGSKDELAQDLSDLDGAEGEADVEEKEEKEEESVEEEAKEEEVEEEPEEEKTEEEDEEEPEVSTSSQPTVKDIKTKYPNIFKEFPSLRSAFFLTPKFLNVFPDPETAEEAASKAVEYDSLESSLVGRGDPSLLVKTLSDNNPKAFRKIIENFGEAVREVSKEDYIALSTPIIEELLYHASKHGERTGNKNLELAAKHMANYVFANGGEIRDVSRKEKAQPSEAEKELEEERTNYAREKFQSALGEISEVTIKAVDDLLAERLDTLTPFERKAVIKEARQEIDDVLQKDKAFQNVLRGLWKRATESGYDSSSKSRIKSAWLERARAIAPGIRNRLRQEALDARTPSKGDSKDKEGQKRQFPTKGGTNSGKRGVLDPSKIDWRKTSDRDILDS